MRKYGPVGRDQHTATWEELEDVSVGKLIFTVKNVLAAITSYDDSPTQYWWFEERWRFLYTRCGFDPKAPGRIVSSEYGLDEGGVGGFPAHGASGADVVRWCQNMNKLQYGKLVVNGTSYDSPFLCGTIFQQGDTSTASNHWGGYAIDNYLNDLKGANWGQ